MALVPSIIENGFKAMIETNPSSAQDACDQLAGYYFAYAATALAGVVPPTLLPAAQTLFSANLFALLGVDPPAGTAASAAGAFVTAVTSFWMTPPVVFGAGVVTAFPGAGALQAALVALFSAFNDENTAALGLATALDVATKTVTVVIGPTTFTLT